MSFLSDAFLGSGGSVDVRSLSTMTPEQNTALQEILARLSGRVNNPNGSLSPAERSSLTALEQRSQAMAVPSPERTAAGNTVTSLMDFNGQTGDASAYFRDRVQNPLLDSFQREILPQISRNFGGADFFTSERQNAEGLARRDLLNTLAGEKSKVELDQFNQSRDRALQASGQVPALTQSDNQSTQVMLDILKALGLPADRQFNNEELIARLIGTPGIENLATVQAGNAGAIPTALGGAASGIGQGLGEAAGGVIKDWFSSLFGNGSGASAVTGSLGGASSGALPVADLLAGVGGAGAGAGVGAGVLGSTLTGGIGTALGAGATTAGASAAGALPIADLLAGIGTGGATTAATAGGAATAAGSGAGAGAVAAGGASTLASAIPAVGALVGLSLLLRQWADVDRSYASGVTDPYAQYYYPTDGYGGYSTPDYNDPNVVAAINAIDPNSGIPWEHKNGRTTYYYPNGRTYVIEGSNLNGTFYLADGSVDPNQNLY